MDLIRFAVLSMVLQLPLIRMLKAIIMYMEFVVINKKVYCAIYDSMFYKCDNLKNVDLTGLNSLSDTNNMSHMFTECINLKTVKFGKLDTSHVIDMRGMFSGCTSLENLNIKKFDTSKVEDMDSMFEKCSFLTVLNLTNFRTSNVTNMKKMFYDYSNLTNIYVDEDSWDITNATTTDMIRNCVTQTVTKI